MTLLAALLIAVMLFIGPGVFTIDEAAYRFQADSVDAGYWGLPYPTEELVDRTAGAPLVNSELGAERWYPAARHPAYVWLLAVSSALAGSYGPVLLSLAGLVLFAVGVEKLCGLLGGVPPGVGFWAGALAGPVTFHGFVSWAHAPAAGMVAIGLAWLLQAAEQSRSGPPAGRAAGGGLSDAAPGVGLPHRGAGDGASHRITAVGPSLPLTLAGAAAVAASVLLRSDGAIAVAAIGGAFAVVSLRQRSYRLPAAAAVLAGTAASVIGGLWHGLVVESGALVGAGSGRGVSLSRYGRSAFEILISPGANGWTLLRLSAVGLLGIGVIWVRRHRTQATAEARVLAAAALMAGVVGAVDVVAYGSLLPACPLLVIGLAGAGTGRSSTTQSPAALVMTIAAAVGLVGPILASVSAGGGLGWGGRYVLLAMPAAIPLALRSASRLWPRPEARPLLLAALALTAVVQLAGVRTLFDYHRLSLTASEQLQSALPPLAEEVDVIIAVDARVGRLAAPTAATIPLLSVADVDRAQALLEDGLADEIRRVAVVSYHNPIALEPPDRWQIDHYRDQPLQTVVVERR